MLRHVNVCDVECALMKTIRHNVSEDENMPACLRSCISVAYAHACLHVCL